MDEASLHELLSGRRSDVGARCLRATLSIASWGYSAAMICRDRGYDQRWLSVQTVDAPVISLGNITTGGTGKTPMAAWLANWLVSEGHRPGLLSRGYRALATPPRSSATEIELKERDFREVEAPAEPESTTDAPSSSWLGGSLALPVSAHPAAMGTIGGNDEKMVLDRLCPGVPHLQQRDRVDSARRLVGEFGCDALILDDGFQHRRLHRDLDLVLVDALQPWGFGHVLPRGLLREPLSGLRRASLVLITRADQCSEAGRAQLEQVLSRYHGAKDCVEVAFKPLRLLGLDSTIQSLSLLSNHKTIAFCGIGNPDGFRRTLASLNSPKEFRVFPDHHHYQSSDLLDLANIARAASADFAVTTLKDLVKIPPGAWTGPPLYAVEIGVEFLNGQELLMSQLKRILTSARNTD